MAPFLPQHDYLLVPSDKNQMIYYQQQPECLQKYCFLGVLKQPEVKNMYSIKVLLHTIYFDQVIEYPKQEMSKVSFSINNDEIGVETYNRFESLVDEEIVEANFSSEKDNLDRSKQKEVSSKIEENILNLLILDSCKKPSQLNTSIICIQIVELVTKQLETLIILPLPSVPTLIVDSWGG